MSDTIACRLKTCRFVFLNEGDRDKHMKIKHPNLFEEIRLREREEKDGPDGYIMYRPEWEMVPLEVRRALIELKVALNRSTDYTGVQLTFNRIRTEELPDLLVQVSPEDRTF